MQMINYIVKIILCFSYIVYDLYAENFYLVDLKLSMCWETYEPCEFIAQLFKNKLLPKRYCPGNMTFEHSGKNIILLQLYKRNIVIPRLFFLILFLTILKTGINKYIVFIRFLTE